MTACMMTKPATMTGARPGSKPTTWLRRSRGMAASCEYCRSSCGRVTCALCTFAESYTRIWSRTATTVVAVPATATRRSGATPAFPASPRCSASCCATHSRAASSSAGAGGSVRMNFSVTRRHPISKECAHAGAWPARPTTISVEPPPISTTIRSWPGKSHDAPENDSPASFQPGMTERTTPSSAKRRTNSSEFPASRDAEVATAMVLAMGAPCSARRSRTAQYPPTVSTVRSIAAGKSIPVASTPSPRLVMAYSRSTSWMAPAASTSATSMRHVTVPMSMAA